METGSFPLCSIFDKSKTELKYGTTDFIDVIWAILLFRQYFEGTNATVSPDHELLKWILHLADSNRVSRQLELTLIEA